MPPEPRAVERLAAGQHGAISRSQLLGLGAEASWAAHQALIGRWQRVYPGVYLTHTGPPEWSARAAAALLYAGPGAALSHGSAGYLHEFTVAAPRRLDVIVPAHRRVIAQPGLSIHLRRRMPPVRGRMRATDRADTLLDLVGEATTEDDVVGLVCAAARARTWPAEILRAMHERSRVRHRRLLLDLLDEVADGLESALERRYHHDVERRHGLPRATLQVRQRVAGGWIRADAVYEGLGVRTELDGALAHPGGRTDADTWRDNAVLIACGDLTLRYRWRHVAVTPCATAGQVEAALHSRGWSGRARPCGPECQVGRRQQRS